MEQVLHGYLFSQIRDLLRLSPQGSRRKRFILRCRAVGNHGSQSISNCIVLDAAGTLRSLIEQHGCVDEGTEWKSQMWMDCEPCWRGGVYTYVEQRMAKQGAHKRLLLNNVFAIKSLHPALVVQTQIYKPVLVSRLRFCLKGLLHGRRFTLHVIPRHTVRFF